MIDTFSELLARVLYDFEEPEFDPISVNAKDFISHLLMKNGRNRMTATQVNKKHNYQSSHVLASAWSTPGYLSKILAQRFSPR